MNTQNITQNVILNTDSYKTSHFGFMAPGTTRQYSYIEARKGGEYDSAVFFNLQRFIKTAMLRPITMEMVEQAEKFIAAHGLPFNREGWEYIVNEHGGMLPLHIRAVPEGMHIPEGNVMVTVENTDSHCAWVTSYIETALLRAVWYGTTVATRSYRFRELIERYLEDTGDPSLIDFKFVDFGARGASSKESSEIAGAAHLINFMATDNIVGILASMEYYNSEEVTGFSIPACYDEQTEILTVDGFKTFQELTDQDKVAQYEENGSISFVSPERIINEHYEGDMYQFVRDGKTGKVDIMVTPNHRMVRRSKANGKIEIHEAKEFKTTHRNQLVQAGKATGLAKSFTALDAFKVAFQADGSYPSRKDSYTGERGGTVPVRFTLKKKRKIERLESILNQLGYHYTVCNPEDRPNTNLYWVRVPVEIQMEKTFRWINVNDMNHEWARSFIEEISLWDGTKKSNSVIFTSINKDVSETVMTIAILAGYRSSMVEPYDYRDNRNQIFQVNICKAFDCSGGAGVKKIKTFYRGRIGCVTVPSGMVVVRRNGTVVVSGNSEHTVTIAEGLENEKQFFERAIDVYGGEGKMVSVVSDTYSFENALDIWAELRDKIEQKGGTVVIRPDSGNPTEMVMLALNKLSESYGYTVNEKGFKVLNPAVRIIQGDGVNLAEVENILETMKTNGFSADNITFGCGGFLLQDLTRDTLRFAMKGSYVEVNGEIREVCKTTETDPTKASKAGRVILVKRDGLRYPITIREEEKLLTDIELLETVFLNGELIRDMTFEEVRENAKKKW